MGTSAFFGKSVTRSSVVILSVFAKDLAVLAVNARCFASLNMTF